MIADPAVFTVACLPASARGRSTSYTAAVPTWSTGTPPSFGRTCRSIAVRQLRAGLSVRHTSCLSAKHACSACAKVGTRARRGSPPVRATARLSAATRRASASETSSALPSPRSTRRPCMVSRWTHWRVPEGLTRSMSPLPST